MTAYSGKQAFQTIRVIHMALMAGLTLFSVVIVFLNPSAPDEAAIDTNILLAAAGGIMIMAIFMGPVIYNQRLAKLHGTEALQQKLAAFQTAHLVRCALLEAGGLFGAVTCILGGNLYGLAITAISLGMFILKMPNESMLSDDLKLTSEEKREIFS